jgi:hypothetical protein
MKLSVSWLKRVGLATAPRASESVLHHDIIAAGQLPARCDLCVDPPSCQSTAPLCFVRPSPQGWKASMTNESFISMMHDFGAVVGLVLPLRLRLRRRVRGKVLAHDLAQHLALLAAGPGQQCRHHHVPLRRAQVL